MIKQRWTSLRLQTKYNRLFNLGEMSCFNQHNAVQWIWVPFRLQTKGRSPLFHHESWQSDICSFRAMTVALITALITRNPLNYTGSHTGMIYSAGIHAEVYMPALFCYSDVPTTDSVPARFPIRHLRRRGPRLFWQREELSMSSRPWWIQPYWWPNRIVNGTHRRSLRKLSYR